MFPVKYPLTLNYISTLKLPQFVLRFEPAHLSHYIDYTHPICLILTAGPRSIHSGNTNTEYGKINGRCCEHEFYQIFVLGVFYFAVNLIWKNGKAPLESEREIFMYDFTLKFAFTLRQRKVEIVEARFTSIRNITYRVNIATGVHDQIRFYGE